MIEQILANLVPLAGLLAVLGFFIKRWMDNLEGQIRSVCSEIDDVKKNKVDKATCHDRAVDEDSDAKEIWIWLKYHTHTAEGHVIVPRKGE